MEFWRGWPPWLSWYLVIDVKKIHQPFTVKISQNTIKMGLGLWSKERRVWGECLCIQYYPLWYPWYFIVKQYDISLPRLDKHACDVCKWRRYCDSKIQSSSIYLPEKQTLNSVEYNTIPLINNLVPFNCYNTKPITNVIIPHCLIFTQSRALIGWWEGYISEYIPIGIYSHCSTVFKFWDPYRNWTRASSFQSQRHTPEPSGSQ